MNLKTFHLASSVSPVARLRALCFLFSVLCSLLAGHVSAQQGGSFRAQTESQIPLTIAQEAENAIDKGQRWLAAQPPPPEVPAQILRRYALAPAGQPFTLQRCDLTPLEQAMPPPTPPNTLTNLTVALTLKPSPKALSAPRLAPTPHPLPHRLPADHCPRWPLGRRRIHRLGPPHPPRPPQRLPTPRHRVGVALSEELFEKRQNRKGWG